MKGRLEILLNFGGAQEHLEVQEEALCYWA